MPRRPGRHRDARFRSIILTADSMISFALLPFFLLFLALPCRAQTTGAWPPGCSKGRSKRKYIVVLGRVHSNHSNLVVRWIIHSSRAISQKYETTDFNTEHSRKRFSDYVYNRCRRKQYYIRYALYSFLYWFKNSYMTSHFCHILQIPLFSENRITIRSYHNIIPTDIDITEIEVHILQVWKVSQDGFI